MNAGGQYRTAAPPDPVVPLKDDCADPACRHDRGDHHARRDNCLAMWCRCPAFATSTHPGILVRNPTPTDEPPSNTPPHTSWPCLACGHHEDEHEEQAHRAWRGRCSHILCKCSDYYPDRG